MFLGWFVLGFVDYKVSWITQLCFRNKGILVFAQVFPDIVQEPLWALDLYLMTIVLATFYSKKNLGQVPVSANLAGLSVMSILSVLEYISYFYTLLIVSSFLLQKERRERYLAKQQIEGVDSVQKRGIVVCRLQCNCNTFFFLNWKLFNHKIR